MFDFESKKKESNCENIVIGTLPGRCRDVMVDGRGWDVMNVLPLALPERRVFVREYMLQYSKKLSDEQVALILSAKQTKNPLYLRTLLEELRVFGSFEKLDAHIAHYLTAKNPPELFALVFSRLEKDYEDGGARKGMVGDGLSLLYVSRRGVSEAELLEILGVSQSSWSRFYVAIEEALVSRQGMLSFFHDYMRQGVDARYLRPRNQYNNYRKRLITYFSSKAAASSEPSPRVCEELPYLLMQSAEWAGLARCITNLPMFMALAEPDRKFDLYAYWRAASDGGGGDLERMLLEAMEEVAGDKDKLLAVLAVVGKFFQDIASYDIAEKIQRDALDIVEEKYGKLNRDHPEIAEKLEGLAYLLRLKGKYGDAYPLYTRAVAIREKTLKPDNPVLAQCINSTAILCRQMGKYPQAEPLYEKALRLRLQIFGNVHEDVAQSLNSLGCLIQDMGRYDKSEAFFKQAIGMREQLCGPNHPDVAMSLSNLAGLYLDQNLYAQAKPLWERSLKIYTAVFGKMHPNVAQTLNSMAALAQEQGLFEEAEGLYSETLAIKRKLLGNKHPQLALTLNDFAVMYARQDKFPDAKALYAEALAIRKEVLGEKHPDYAQSLNNMGSLLQDMGQYAEALPVFQQALAINEAAFGREHMDVANTLTNMAGLFQFLGRHDEAIPLYRRALDIYEKLLGETHADVAVTMNDLAVLYFRTGNYAESEKNYTKSLEIYEAVFGDVHPDVAQALLNVGEFYKAQGKLKETKKCFERAHSIYASVFGQSHARTVRVAGLLAALPAK